MMGFWKNMVDAAKDANSQSYTRDKYRPKKPKLDDKLFDHIGTFEGDSAKYKSFLFDLLVAIGK